MNLRSQPTRRLWKWPDPFELSGGDIDRNSVPACRHTPAISQRARTIAEILSLQVAMPTSRWLACALRELVSHQLGEWEKCLRHGPASAVLDRLCKPGLTCGYQRCCKRG